MCIINYVQWIYRFTFADNCVVSIFSGLAAFFWLLSSGLLSFLSSSTILPSLTISSFPFRSSPPSSWAFLTSSLTFFASGKTFWSSFLASFITSFPFLFSLFTSLCAEDFSLSPCSALGASSFLLRKWKINWYHLSDSTESASWFDSRPKDSSPLSDCDVGNSMLVAI